MMGSIWDGIDYEKLESIHISKPDDLEVDTWIAEMIRCREFVIENFKEVNCGFCVFASEVPIWNF